MTPVRNAFADLDEAVLAARVGAFVVTLHEHDHRSLLTHVARRLRAASALVIEVTAQSSVSIFREVATQLGLGKLPCTPRAYAEAIASASREPTAVLASLPAPDGWDALVARELVELGSTILVLATSSSASPAWASSVFDLRAELTAADKLRWVSAIVHASAPLVGQQDLHGLETWWESLEQRRNGSLERALSAEASELMTALALARRSVSHAALARVGIDVGIVDELLAAQVLLPNASALVLAPFDRLRGARDRYRKGLARAGRPALARGSRPAGGRSVGLLARCRAAGHGCAGSSRRRDRSSVSFGNEPPHRVGPRRRLDVRGGDGGRRTWAGAAPPRRRAGARNGQARRGTALVRRHCRERGAFASRADRDR